MITLIKLIISSSVDSLVNSSSSKSKSFKLIAPLAGKTIVCSPVKCVAPLVALTIATPFLSAMVL
ncbi:hypothetical protein [Mesoplasma melaleucae]|uniref:hypothetical protein n=1 Tax=Mesoplasma melaleucae TaxID=81459 RepID=UPI000485E539|nr:hypothetical protein [Mesoplasma melaleucae]